MRQIATILLSSLLLSKCVFAAAIVDLVSVSPDTLAIIIERAASAPGPSAVLADYSVNGKSPESIGRWSYVWQQGKAVTDLAVRDLVYLRLDEPLVEGANYAIGTPFGQVSFVFEAGDRRAESIKVNQVGYARAAGASATFAAWAGSLGKIALATAPLFEVRHAGGALVKSAVGEYLGIDDNPAFGSGDHVYRLRLDGVPDGGPYHVVIPGIGRSHDFTIGAPPARHTARQLLRALYHQRCGAALEASFTVFTRGVCHTSVQVTDAEPPGFITANGPTRSISGGYHDAGDFDRRQFHTLIPAWMLTLFDAFPRELAEVEFGLPESGDAVPDWLDEALWGVRIWEQLQEPDGAVRAGTEANQHPTYGAVAADTDVLVYRTYRIDGHATASAAGLFAQASRLVAPYDPTRAATLLSRATSAWQRLTGTPALSAPDAQMMYAALQLYLATGDSTYHTAFKARVSSLADAGWPAQYRPAYFNLPTVVAGQVFSPYFAPYLWTDRPTDEGTRTQLASWLQTQANAVLAADTQRKWPTGIAPNAAWGSLSSQGRYADPLIYAYRIHPQAKYLHAAARLRDYALGLNPLGKSFITGLGANPPQTPLHLDSYFTAQDGLGPVPGVTIFGPFASPSSVDYQRVVWEKAYPAWTELPPARRFSEGWSLVPVNEFSTTETMAPNAVLHAFVAYVGVPLFADGFE